MNPSSRTSWTLGQFTSLDLMSSFGPRHWWRLSGCFDSIEAIDGWFGVLWGVFTVGKDFSGSQVSISGLDDVGRRRQRGRLTDALWHLLSSLPGAEVWEVSGWHPVARVGEWGVGSSRRLLIPRKAWTRLASIMKRPSTNAVGCRSVDVRRYLVKPRRSGSVVNWCVTIAIRKTWRSLMDWSHIRASTSAGNRLGLHRGAKNPLPRANRRPDVPTALWSNFRSSGGFVIARIRRHDEAVWIITLWRGHTGGVLVFSERAGLLGGGFMLQGHQRTLQAFSLKSWPRSRSRAPCVGISVVWTQIAVVNEQQHMQKPDGSLKFFLQLRSSKDRRLNMQFDFLLNQNSRNLEQLKSLLWVALLTFDVLCIYHWKT